MSGKTNAVRIVQQAKIPFREAFYAFDENDLNGKRAAQAINMPETQVYKTLVTTGNRTGINVFCIPVCAELDLKKAAQVSGNKNISMVPVKDLLQLTGYIRGGCSPIGMKKKYPTFFQESCRQYDLIAVSAGQRGHQMILPPMSLVDLVDGTLTDIIL